MGYNQIARNASHNVVSVMVLPIIVLNVFLEGKIHRIAIALMVNILLRDKIPAQLVLINA